MTPRGLALSTSSKEPILIFVKSIQRTASVEPTTVRKEIGRVATEEFLLNLNPDFVRPPFGSIQPVFKVSDLRLPLFGGSKLRRYVVRRLVVCVGCPLAATYRTT
jgi:hypothetical protein